jgi:hypothetical protein
MLENGTTVSNTWSFNYNAALSVNGAPLFDTLAGPVDATWHWVQVTAGKFCTITDTTDDRLSDTAVHEELVVTSQGPGVLQLAVIFGSHGTLPPLTGTWTTEGSGDCGPVDMVTPSTLYIDEFTARGPAGKSTFKGTQTNDQDHLFVLPDASYANFTVDWDLTLVPK